LESSRENPYLCGFPVYTLFRHLSRLNEDGYTVAIYDQDEVDKKKRYRKAIYSPFLRGEYEEEMGASDMSLEMKDDYLYSICMEEYTYREQKQGKIQRVFCSYSRIHTKTGNLLFGESDHASFQDAFHSFYLQNKPKRIILFSTEGQDMSWIYLQYPYTEIVQGNLDRKPMTENEQICIFQTAFHFHPRDYISFMERHDFHRYPFAMQCIAKTLKYIRRFDPILITHLQIPSLDKSLEKKDMNYNYDLLHELNLFHSTRDKIYYGNKITDKKEKTVFSILSKHMNPMAKRYFFELLRNPCRDLHELQQRRSHLKQCAERNLSQNSNFLFQQKDIMDLEIYLLKWKRNRLSPSKILLLLDHYKQCFKDGFQQTEALEKTLQEFHQDWNFEKSTLDNGNVHSRLDLLPSPMTIGSTLEQFYQRREKLQTEIDDFSTKHIIPVTLWNQEEMIYPLSLTLKKWNQQKSEWLSSGYYEISKTTSTMKFSHPELDRLHTLWKQINEDIQTFKKKEFQDYCSQWLSTHSSLLQSFHQWYSETMCWSFLHDFFISHHYINPSLENLHQGSPFVEFQQLRHPILEILHPDHLFVPFDGSIGVSNIGVVLYGMNGSGKSTLLRTIGCALWLAQCGFYVPCSSSFRFYPFDSIFSKINIQDNIYIGHSTFVAEMYELKHILEQVDHKSLVLCDELTSGTESQSATALVVSTLIEFIEKKTRFIVTTHLHDIMTNPNIQSYRNSITVFHFEMELENKDLYIPNIQHRYHRKLREGTGKSLYGIEIAKQIGLPDVFLRRAFEIREQSSSHISRYNPRLVKTQCFLCQSKHDLHTHHITPQVQFHNKDTLSSSKNGLYNLVVLCRYCHEQLHSSPLSQKNHSKQ
jgi:DNA mismatch repair protein MutS